MVERRWADVECAHRGTERFVSHGRCGSSARGRREVPADGARWVPDGHDDDGRCVAAAETADCRHPVSQEGGSGIRREAVASVWTATSAGGGRVTDDQATWYVDGKEIARGFDVWVPSPGAGARTVTAAAPKAEVIRLRRISITLRSVAQSIRIGIGASLRSASNSCCARRPHPSSAGPGRQGSEYRAAQYRASISPASPTSGS